MFLFQNSNQNLYHINQYVYNYLGGNVEDIDKIEDYPVIDISGKSLIGFDYNNNMVTTEFAHYLDFYSNVHCSPNTALLEHARQSNVHIHTFTITSIIELLDYCKTLFDFKVLDIQPQDIHIAVLLQKGV